MGVVSARPGSTQGRVGTQPLGRLTGQAEVSQPAHGGSRFVQRVKVQPGCAGLKQFIALLRGLFDAELRPSRIVVGELVESPAQSSGNFRATQLGKLLDLRSAQDGDDPVRISDT